MNIVVFLLLMIICIGLIYIVHKYFGKEEFYILTAIYSVLAFFMSFKLINVFGIDINAGIIFSSGIIAILYYFVNKYNRIETKRISFVIFTATIVTILFLIIDSSMIPSLYDRVSNSYKEVVLGNIPILILYPISLSIILYLSGYCFNELKDDEKNKIIKLFALIAGIIFIDTGIFIYFSYAILVRFNTAIMIALGNYVVKSIIVCIYVYIVNKLFKVRKVK